MGRALAVASWAVVVTLGSLTIEAAPQDDLADVVQGDGAARQAAIRRLRDQGSAGLAMLLERYRELEQRLATNPDNAQLADRLRALNQAVDEVGGAKFCRQSGLYWHTDLVQAQAAARAEGKPILALRLLGNLTDEFSCANSRFFRTTLYANTEIARYLRENYVLSWKSVRPVPRITIDFGDGRKVERTITGNSAHYILTADGQVVDALPGLYGPAAFLVHLKQAREVAARVGALSEADRAAELARYHQFALAEIARRWLSDLDRLGAAAAPVTAAIGAPPSRTPQEAIEALRQGPAASPWPFAELERRTTDEVWDRIAAFHANEATLDEVSKRIVAAEAPNAAQAGRLAITKRVVENPLLRLIQNLERSISLDTVKNEYTLHRQVHEWLAETPDAGANVDALNDQVYARLFLMPRNDPWLGLAPPDVYSALPNNGVVSAMR